MEFLKRIVGTKTFKLAVAGLLTTVAAYLNGTITEVEAISAVFAALYAIFNRDAVMKSGPEGN